MVPDIVKIKRLCLSGQWLTRIENGKVLLHDTVSGETVCVGQTSAEPVRHGRWGCYESHLDGYRCSKCKITHRSCTAYCPNCGAKMDAEVSE